MIDLNKTLQSNEDYSMKFVFYGGEIYPGVESGIVTHAKFVKGSYIVTTSSENWQQELQQYSGILIDAVPVYESDTKKLYRWSSELNGWYEDFNIVYGQFINNTFVTDIPILLKNQNKFYIDSITNYTYIYNKTSDTYNKLTIDIGPEIDKKQNKLISGDGIVITPTENDKDIISVDNQTIQVNWGNVVGDISTQNDLIDKFNEYETKISTEILPKIDKKQNKLISGDNIIINPSDDEDIISVDSQNLNVLWGNVVGDMSTQNDLIDKFNEYETKTQATNNSHFWILTGETPPSSDESTYPINQWANSKELHINDICYHLYDEIADLYQFTSNFSWILVSAGSGGGSTFAINSFTSNLKFVEKGTTVNENQLKLIWEFNEVPRLVELTENDLNIQPVPQTQSAEWNNTNKLTTNTKYTLIGTDKRRNSISKSLNVIFCNPVFWGISTEVSGTDEMFNSDAFIKTVQNTRKATYSNQSAEIGYYFYYLVPTEYCDKNSEGEIILPTFTVGVFPGGFINAGIIHKTVGSTQVEYLACRSTNSGLTNITVSIT